MRIGLIARADRRGLGLQTKGYHDHLQPERTLVIDPGKFSPVAQNFDWYPDGIRVRWEDDQSLDRQTIGRFLRGLDVVLTAETPYWYPLYDMARELGVRTILHANPEFYRHALDPHLPRPSTVWLPTSWHADRIPHDRILPVPVDRSRFPFRPRTSASTFLHVVGQPAVRDRNGTHLTYKAFYRIRRPATLIIRAQRMTPRLSVARTVKLRLIVEDVVDQTELYSEGDVLVYPRRYGGNSLPLHEALSCGMPVLMTDASPQSSFLPPEMLIFSRPGIGINTQLGRIGTFDADPNDLMHRVQGFIDDPSLVERMSKEADRLAQSVSWEVLKPVYLQAFAEAMEKPL